MTNAEKAKALFYHFCTERTYGGYDSCENCPKSKSHEALLEIAQWKDEQFKQQLNSLKDEIQSNLCASSGFNDEYSHGHQDCGMKVMEMIDKILEL